MDCPKVSVVVPIYNVEQYIERCVRSLFEQTLTEVEYIFVNDCTPDNSILVLKNVLEDFPERKPWVRLIDLPKNVGLPQARREGLSIAKGEYIIHCDSDDWVEYDMYRAMYEVAVSKKLDMVACQFCLTDGNTTIADIQYPKEGCDLISSYLTGPLSPCVWNKLIHRRIALSDDIIVPKENMSEDFALSVQYAIRIKLYTYLDNVYYYYYKNPDSISRDGLFQKRLKQHCANFDLILAVLSRHNLLEKYNWEIVRSKYITRTSLFNKVLDSPSKYLSEWRSMYPEINWQYPFMKTEPLGLRIVFVLTLIGIYPYLYKLLKWYRRI